MNNQNYVSVEQIIEALYEQPKEVHTVKCVRCGRKYTVPYKPYNNRPIYCVDCYVDTMFETKKEDK